MPMTPQQLRASKKHAQRMGARQRPPIRRRVRAWLEPLRKAFEEIKTGEVMAFKGYPVTQLRHDDDLARIDHCINGFLALINRLMPDYDVSAMEKVSRKLGNGILLEMDEVERCLAMLPEIEDRLMTFKLGELIDASVTEQIKISFELMGVAEE